MAIKLAKLLCPTACAIALTGCIAVPLPHYTRSSPHVSARVIDSETRAPIEGARYTPRAEMIGRAMWSNKITSLDAAIAPVFHAGGQRRGASEFHRYA